MTDERRNLTSNIGDDAAPTTSLYADIMAILKTYSKLDVCTRIIFAYHSNGNEARHSVIHRGTGNKRVSFWRGLQARALLHSVLRYDFSQEVMLTQILTAAGLPTLSTSVCHAFKEQSKLRKYTWKRSKDPVATKKRKLLTLVRRKLDRRDRIAEGGDVHVSGIEYEGADDSQVPSKRARKTGGVRRCGLCQEFGHKKSVCDYIGVPIQLPNSDLPVLNKASNGLSALNRRRLGDIIMLIDLEATSGNVYSGEIIQLAASLHDWSSMKALTVKSGSSTFMQYAQYNGRLSASAVAVLPHMDWDAVETADTFKQLMKGLALFISRVIVNYPDRRLLMCGHSILTYDIPILHHCCKRIDVDLFKLLSDLQVKGFIDTLQIVSAKQPVLVDGADDQNMSTGGDPVKDSVKPSRIPKTKKISLSYTLRLVRRFLLTAFCTCTMLTAT
jgi:hypothetical protein